MSTRRFSGFSGDGFSTLDHVGLGFEQAGYRVADMIAAAVLDSRFNLNADWIFAGTASTSARLDGSECGLSRAPGRHRVADAGAGIGWAKICAEEVFSSDAYSTTPTPSCRPPSRTSSPRCGAQPYDGENSSCRWTDSNSFLRFLKEKGDDAAGRPVRRPWRKPGRGMAPQAHGFFCLGAAVHVPLIMQLQRCSGAHSCRPVFTCR